MATEKTKTKTKAIEVTPYAFQESTLDAADAGKRFIAMIGGTGGGKTWWSPWWLSDQIVKDHKAGNGKGARYIALGRTSDMVRDMLLPVIEGAYIGTRLAGHYHRSERRYELPTGGNIFLRSADKPHRIEGHHARAMIVDEPSDMGALIWPIIQNRTGYYQGPVLFCGYPTNMGWYYNDIFLPWQGGDPDYAVIQFRSIDNPLYPVEEYKRAKRTMPKWLFDMRHDGKFCKPFGLVYPEFGTHLYVEPFEIPGDWPVHVIVDPGVFFGTLFLAWHDNDWYAFNEHYTTNVEPARVHAEKIKEKLEGAVVDYIYDPSRKTDVANLEDHGLGPFRKANNAVLDGVATVTGVIREGRLKVMRGRCPCFVDQMEKYSFPTEAVTGEVKSDNPIKKDDHLPDCLRYGLHTVEGPALVKPKKKARVLWKGGE